MCHPLVDILGSPDGFLDDLLEQVATSGIDVTDLYMDHICYRVETLEEYQNLSTQLLNIGILRSDNIIGGRPISVIEINDSYRYLSRDISVIELPAPKEGSPYTSGYEHVEFVVKESLESFQKKHPTVNFDSKGMEKALNRDLRLKLKSGAVKFHEHSLLKVIEMENQSQ